MPQETQISVIKKGLKENPSPIYLFMGEEPYYIDLLSSYAEENLLTEEERAFNQVVMYGSTSTIADIVDTAQRFPMGASHQVVIVREAQSLDTQIDKLAGYVSSPSPTTVLVLCYKGKKMDARKSVYKSILKNGVVYESKKVYENTLPLFIKENLEQYGIGLTQKAVMMIMESLGTDLSRIAQEMKKVSLVLPAGSTLTPDMVEKYIGISREFNNFEFQRAISTRDAVKAMRIAEYFSTSKDASPIATVAILYGFFTKMILYHNSTDRSPAGLARELGVPPFVVKDYQMAAQYYNLKQSVRAIDVLRRIDLMSKGVGATGVSVYDIYKELIFSMINL